MPIGKLEAEIAHQLEEFRIIISFFRSEDRKSPSD